MPPAGLASLEGEELDAGEPGVSHQVALWGEEPPDLYRSLDHMLLGRPIGGGHAQELEHSRHGGVVQELVTNGLVAPLTATTATEAHQSP